MEGEATEEVPLWQSCNEEWKRLQALWEDKGRPAVSARGWLYQESCRYVEENGKCRSSCQGAAQKDALQALSHKRTAEFEAAHTRLLELRDQLQTACHKLRESLLTFLFVEDVYLQKSLSQELLPEPFALFQFYSKQARQGPSAKLKEGLITLATRATEEAVAALHPTHETWLQELASLAEFVLLLKFLHSHQCLPLSLILFEHTRGTTKKELTSSTLPNWPALRNCFYALRNIEKRLKDEETKKRFCKEELRFQQRKLQLAAIILFNNPEVRLSKQVPAKLPEIEADLYPFLASPPEKKLLVGFITPIEFVMDTFRSLIAEQTVHKILSVEGDGNCFFRAVIKFMYPEIPRDWEDVLSLKLRKKINTGTEQKLKKNGMAEEYPYQGFVIQDVNDSITMAKAGVWADHIQVQKLSNLLERPIQVVAFDDLSLRLTYNRTLAPGRDLIIGSQFASEGNGDKQQRSSQRGLPILLYFTPTPGHYEALSLPSDKDAPANLIDTFDQLSQSVSLYLDGALDMIPSFSLVSFYFKLETNGNLVQEIYSRLSNRESREIKQAIEVELNERVSKQLTLISRFKALLDELGKPYLEKLAKLPEWHIDGEVLSTLLADALAFGPERELLVRGSGPLSQLTERALACCPPSFSLESSCPSSSEIFNAPQRHSPRMGEEKGKSESPATPQGDINNTKQGESPTAEKMLSQDSTGEAEWVAFLRRAAEPDGGANLVAKGGRASARSLSNLLSALETLYKRHDVKITDLHLWNLSLDKEACEVLAPPEGLPYWLKSLQLHACSLALPPNSLQSSHPKLSLFNCS